MPVLCPLCARDDDTQTHDRDDGISYAVCLDRSHGPDGFVWEPTPPPGPSIRSGKVPSKRVRFFIDPTKSDEEIAEAIMAIAKEHFEK